MVGKYKTSAEDYCKTYYLKNRDHIQMTNKRYYENNKEKILKKTKCECGGSYCAASASIHRATKKHLNYEQKQLINEMTRIETEDIDFIDEIFKS